MVLCLTALWGNVLCFCQVPIRPKAEEAEQLVAAVDAACVTAAELIAGPLPRWTLL